MNIKTVKEYRLGEETGKVVDVNIDKKKVYMFDNRRRRVIYNAPIVENGKEIGFWTDWLERDIVTDTEAKVRAFCGGEFLINRFADYLERKGDSYDANYRKKLIKYIDLNAGIFFDKYGDWRNKKLIMCFVNWEDVEAIEI